METMKSGLFEVFCKESLQQKITKMDAGEMFVLSDGKINYTILKNTETRFDLMTRDLETKEMSAFNDIDCVELLGKISFSY